MSETEARRQFSTTSRLPLGSGRRSSARWLLALLWSWTVWLAAPEARAAGARYAVLIGNNQGAPGEAILRYAESDAHRLAAVLRNVGGFPAQNVLVLEGLQAADVSRALIATNDRIRAQSGTAERPLLFVYYSGHASARALHQAGSEFELKLLEQLVRSSAATFRVLVVDACRSGALTRVKGGTPAPPFLPRIEQRIQGEGAVVLTSSSWNEDSQESDALGASFFTHFFRSGLLGAGDVDSDGRVTLAEAYAHAYERTLQATSRTWAGAQHPTFRYDIRGQGEIVLTQPAMYRSRRATLVLPGKHSYLVLEGGATGPVAAEVSAASARSLSLRPGRYFLLGRAKDHLLEGSVELLAGQTFQLLPDTLSRVEYARLVRKGGGARRAQAVEIGYVLHTQLANAETPCHGGMMGYRLTLPAVDLTLRGELCRSGFQGQGIRATTTELLTDVSLGVTTDLSVLSLRASLSAGPAWFHQTFETTGRAPPRTSWAGHAGIALGADVDLPAGFRVIVEAGGRTYVSRLLDAKTDRSSVAATSALRTIVGLGRWW